MHGEADGTDLSLLLLGNGGLEHSLLEAVEGLEGLDLGGGQKSLPPLLPEKRRGSESREPPPRSPSLGGFCSLSTAFSSPITSDSLRGASGAPSPGSGRRFRRRAPFSVALQRTCARQPLVSPLDFGGKTDAVKFVQDTSKFWYKPDISRDQGAWQTRSLMPPHLQNMLILIWTLRQQPSRF